MEDKEDTSKKDIDGNKDTEANKEESNNQDDQIFDNVLWRDSMKDGYIAVRNY